MLRDLIASALETGRLSDEDLALLCQHARDASGWRWRERAIVCRYLGELPQTERQRAEAADVLARAVDVRDPGAVGRGQRMALRVLVATAVLVPPICAAVGPPSLSMVPAILAAVISFCMLPIAALSNGLEDRRTNWLRRQALAALERLAMPGSLGAVARATRARDAWVRAAALRAVRPVLAATSPIHYGHLGDAVLPVCDLLRSLDRALVVAATEALGRFGDGRAVEPIEQLLGIGTPRAIAEAADRVLPVLRERQRQERDASRLLRPSDAPQDGSTLLRPASAAAAIDEVQLLRPADGPVE